MPLTPVDYRKTAETHRRDTRANQPAAADVLEGTLYYVTDEGLMERSTGSVWEDVSDGVVGPDGVLSHSLSIGTDPANFGALRLANFGLIQGRNAANSGNIHLVRANSDDTVVVGDTGNALILQGSANISNSDVYVTGNMMPNTTGVRNVGRSDLRWLTLIGTVVNLAETAAPSAPAANEANVWVQDNGAGKTQLMVEFNTGGPIQIAIQP